MAKSQPKQYPIVKYRIITGDGYHTSTPGTIKEDLLRAIQHAEDVDKKDGTESYKAWLKNRFMPKHVIKITEELIPINEIL